MSILNSGLAKSSAADAYTIDNSLKLHDTGYLARTPGSEGNRKTWTYSFWVKRSNLSVEDHIVFYPIAGSFPYNGILFNSSNNNFAFYGYSGSYDFHMATSQLFRDASAWYHFVIMFDTTQSTEANRIKIYVNGEQVTDFSTESYPAEDYEGGINRATEFSVGGDGASAGLHGYLAEVYFTDGTAYAASDFGELSSTTNQWIPKDAVDDLTFGTNGFYQKYAAAYPYGEKTVLLLHCDGSNGGTTFTDATGNMTVTSTACTTTTSDKKFGTASADFDGGATERYLVVTHTSNMDFDGEFTIDFWTKVAAAAPTLNNRFYQKGENSSTGWGLFMDSTNIYFGREDEDLGCGFARNLVVGTGDWHHIAVTRGSDNYFRIFLDGVLKDTSDSAHSDNLNDSASPHIGANPGDANTNVRFNGLIDEFRIVKGLALWTATFTPATEAYSSLGLDSSGNGNDFSVGNLVATDQVLDSPTNNFATLNPLQIANAGSPVFSEGNLKYRTFKTGGDNVQGEGTIGFTSGKWYWEIYLIGFEGSTARRGGIGIGDSVGSGTWTTDCTEAAIYMTGENTGYSHNTTLSSAGDSWTANSGGEIFCFAFDADAGTLIVTKNTAITGSETTGKWTGFATSTVGYRPITVEQSASDYTEFVYNFGQDSSFAAYKTSGSAAAQDSNDKGDFYYEPPTDYLALCTDNLSAPEIKLPGENFNSLLYTGTGATNARTGLGFQPDFTWIKRRSGTTQHMLFDSIRLAPQYLVSNDSDAEATDANQLESFDSDGFTVGSGSSTNGTSATFVGWNWKAGGAPTADNDNAAGAVPDLGSVMIDGVASTAALAGTIAATKISANTTSGFSIVAFEGNGVSGATVAHGLSKAPELVIVKATDAAESWYTGSTAGSLDFTDYMRLNTTTATADDLAKWNDSDPSASVVTFGDDGSTNGSGTNFILYNFYSVEGYSKVGSYEGNGDDDGTFIYTGFEPAFFMAKIYSAADDWMMLDNTRSPYNQMILSLAANDNKAEISATGKAVDFLSNGVKMRNDDNGLNQSSQDFIYLAFAASPFKYSNAR